MAVSIPSSRRFEAAAPRPLVKTGLVVLPGYDQFDVAPDGRFLITKPARPDDGTVIDVVLKLARVEALTPFRARELALQPIG